MLSLLAFAAGAAGASENLSGRGENRARLEPQGFLYGAALGIDSRYVDYYYGVTDTEATSFRPAYDGDSALNTTLGLTLATPALLGGPTRIVIENTWFDSEISDSPLTDEDSSLSLFVAFSKFFGS